MRSTADLIEELEAESAQHFTCCIAVAFEDTTIMIQAKEEGRRELLDDAIRQGGTPIGLIVSDKDEARSTLTIMRRVYPEHEGEAREVCQNCLDRIAEQVRGNLEK